MEKLAREILKENPVLLKRCRIVLSSVARQADGYTFAFSGTQIELVLSAIGAIQKENGKYYANAKVTL